MGRCLQLELDLKQTYLSVYSLLLITFTDYLKCVRSLYHKEVIVDTFLLRRFIIMIHMMLQSARIGLERGPLL